MPLSDEHRLIRDVGWHCFDFRLRLLHGSLSCSFFLGVAISHDLLCQRLHHVLDAVLNLIEGLGLLVADTSHASLAHVGQGRGCLTRHGLNLLLLLQLDVFFGDFLIDVLKELFFKPILHIVHQHSHILLRF